MEDSEKKESGSCCDMHSMGRHGCCGGKNHLVKIILSLLIVMMIFCFGFKLGEITGSIKGNGNWGKNNYGCGMMRGDNYFKNAPLKNQNFPTPPTPTQE